MRRARAAALLFRIVRMVAATFTTAAGAPALRTQVGFSRRFLHVERRLGILVTCARTAPGGCSTGSFEMSTWDGSLPAC